MHTQAVQLSLFGENQPLATGRPQIRWSYSRRGELERCPRKYYYDYYGSKVRLAPGDPLKQQLQELSKLSNRHLRAGNLLHLAIRTYLKSDHIGAHGQGLIDWVVRIFRQDRDFSKTDRGFRNADDQRYAPTCLLEFYYHLDEADALYEKAEYRLVTAVTHFLTNDRFEFLRFGGRRHSAQIERMVSVDDALFAAQGKVDIAFRDNTGVTIADWKIGSLGGADANLQLGFYGLWGTHVYKCAPLDITVHVAHLYDERLTSSVMSNAELRRVRARIVQDLEKMTLLDPYGRNGVVEVFKQCRKSKICVMCQYQGLCLDQV